MLLQPKSYRRVMCLDSPGTFTYGYPPTTRQGETCKVQICGCWRLTTKLRELHFVTQRLGEPPTTVNNPGLPTRTDWCRHPGTRSDARHVMLHGYGPLQVVSRRPRRREIGLRCCVLLLPRTPGRLVPTIVASFNTSRLCLTPTDPAELMALFTGESKGCPKA